MGLYRPELAETIDTDSAVGLFAAHNAAGGDLSGVRGALYLDYKTYLPGDLLHLSDRLAMAQSLEIRVPYVDHRLVERVFPLPDRMKIAMWKSKPLLRRALRSRLPSAHFAAPKRGFVGPTAVWLRHELRDTLLDELATDRIKALGYFDGDSVHTLIDEHLSHKHNHESLLWALLCFSTWHRLNCEQRLTTREYKTAAVSR